jgi:uncharacterized membrane protein
MKTLFYVVMALMSIVCAISALIVLGKYPLDEFQTIAMVLLEILSLACLFISVYQLPKEVKIMNENRMYDKAAREQLEYDWYYYEALFDYAQAHVNSREN